MGGCVGLPLCPGLVVLEVDPELGLPGCGLWPYRGYRLVGELEPSGIRWFKY